MGMENKYRPESKGKKSDTLGFIVGGLIGILGVGLPVMNQASLNNAYFTNCAARGLCASVLKEEKVLSRENALEFLQSIGYSSPLAEDKTLYFRPVVEGFWSNKVEVVIAPQTLTSSGKVREGNLLFDAYGRNPAGEVIASFTQNELAQKGYSMKGGQGSVFFPDNPVLK